MEYLVEERTAGKTVLEVMKRELGISSALLKHLKFTEGGILVDDRHVTVRYVLRQGERLSLATDDREPGERLIPVCLPLRIAYEDEDVAVVVKPCGMVVHPAAGNESAAGQLSPSRPNHHLSQVRAGKPPKGSG